MKSDDVFRKYAKKPARLTLKLLDQDGDEQGFASFVLIERNARSLKLLDKLLKWSARTKDITKNPSAPTVLIYRRRKIGSLHSSYRR